MKKLCQIHGERNKLNYKSVIEIKKVKKLAQVKKISYLCNLKTNKQKQFKTRKL